jgi:hypothetical protein
MWLGFLEKSWNVVSLDTPCNIVKSQSNSAIILIRLQDDQRSAVLIPYRDRLLCFPEAPDWLLGPPSSYQIGTVASDLHSPIHLHGMVQEGRVCTFLNIIISLYV